MSFHVRKQTNYHHTATKAFRFMLAANRSSRSAVFKEPTLFFAQTPVSTQSNMGMSQSSKFLVRLQDNQRGKLLITITTNRTMVTNHTRATCQVSLHPHGQFAQQHLHQQSRRSPFTAVTVKYIQNWRHTNLKVETHVSTYYCTIASSSASKQYPQNQSRTSPFTINSHSPYSSPNKPTLSLLLACLLPQQTIHDTRSYTKMRTQINHVLILVLDTTQCMFWALKMEYYLPTYTI